MLARSIGFLEYVHSTGLVILIEVDAVFECDGLHWEMEHWMELARMTDQEELKVVEIHRIRM